MTLAERAESDSPTLPPPPEAPDLRSALLERLSARIERLHADLDDQFVTAIELDAAKEGR